MQDYYENLWDRLPDELELPDFELRSRFVLGEARSVDRVLDLGCGDGSFTATLAPNVADAVGPRSPRPPCGAPGAATRRSSSSSCRSTARCRSPTARSISSGAPR